MTLATRIQTATKTYRDTTVAGMSDAAVRAAALAAGINGSETTPIVTLREELVELYRNNLRKNNQTKPSLMDSPTPGQGNPGNDNVTLT